VRVAPGGGWLAQPPLRLDAAGRPDPAGAIWKQLVSVGTELGEGLTRPRFRLPAPASQPARLRVSLPASACCSLQHCLPARLLPSTLPLPPAEAALVHDLAVLWQEQAAGPEGFQPGQLYNFPLPR
jgi:hypothetical protein